jgi:hypothetical protein
MTHLDALRSRANAVTAYSDALTALLRQEPLGTCLSRAERADLIATAAAYLMFRNGDTFAMLEANATRHRLREIADEAFELLGYGATHNEWLRREFGSDPDSQPDPL